MDLNNLFTDVLKDKLIEEIGEKLGTDKDSTNSALNIALPKLLGQLGKNISSQEDLEKIDKAIDKGHNSSGINLDLEDGAKILSHIMGGSSSGLGDVISQKTNLTNAESGDILNLASSFIMENLGKAKNEGKLNLGNLGGILQIAKRFLDKDGDGEITDDLISMGMNIFSKRS